MKISRFTREYTCRYIGFKDFMAEVWELLVELVRFSRRGIREEFGDSVVFLQIWLWNRFGLEGNLWGLGMCSYRKFMDRRKMWERMYAFAGIKEKCTCCHNYDKRYKVVRQLTSHGVSKKVALEAYGKFVRK